MKTKIFALLMILSLFAAPVLAEEPPPAEKAEAPAEKAEGEKADDWKIGEKLDGENITKLITKFAEASQQKGSFWRNPSLWEAIWLLILIILGAIASYFGWKKKKWGKVIVAIQTAVSTIYLEWVRDAKVKAKAGAA